MKLIYLVGPPGSGKSTLMDRVTAGWERLPLYDAPVPHDALVDPVTGVSRRAEIGKRRGQFSGTDALSSAIIERAVPWLATRPYGILFAEGARLGNRRFLAAAVAAGYDVTLVVLDHADTERWRTARGAELGKTQNPAWVRGRATAVRNLAADPGPGVAVVRGHPNDLAAKIMDLTDGRRV